MKEDILMGIDSMRFEIPTPVQVQVIPAVMSGRDVMATAQTGTGKTAAFVVPILNHLFLKGAEINKISALIIVPTRELVLQIDQQLEGFSYFLNISFVSVYGGGDSVTWEQQKTALTTGVEIIVATPGRLLSHINLGYIDFSNLEFLVLDEVDRMLDMGFYDDIMKILDFLPHKRQNLMFSATIPPNIKKMAGKILVDPVFIDIEGSKPAEGVVQAVYFLGEDKKQAKILELFTGKEISSAIVFASSKLKVKKIASELKTLGLDVRAIHSDLEQKERELVMRDFRNRKIQILVATDVISRGIDVKGLDLVINYDVPSDPEDYIHRVGRTARAHSSGVALTFVSPREKRDLYKIERFLGNSIYKIPD